MPKEIWWADVTKEAGLESVEDFRERMAKDQKNLDELFGTMEGLNGTLEKILHDKQERRTLRRGIQIA